MATINIKTLFFLTLNTLKTITHLKQKQLQYFLAFITNTVNCMITIAQRPARTWQYSIKFLVLNVKWYII